MEWLDLEWAILLHQQALNLTSEENLLRGDAEGILESAINAPKNFYFYQNEKRVPFLAGIIAARVSQSQAFLDGNKRAAFFLMLRFMNLNSRPYDKKIGLNQKNIN
jgi:death-on-curing protein